MNFETQNTVGSVVAKDLRFADVFKKNGIDFCCGGGATIEAACEGKNIDPKEILRQIEEMEATNSKVVGIDFNTFPLDLLVDYIEKTHHRYIRENVPLIIQYVDKVASVHGDRHPELVEVRDLFHGCATEITNHLAKEENILFPYIKQLVEADLSGSQISMAPFGSVKNPIAMMIEEHEGEGARFEKISTLTNNYTAPEDACMTYRVTFDKLKDFEEDLHNHVHLENNILFLRAAELENRLVK
ncbi:iron-sulfur cluster repair di-iron protein [Flammeovirga kamogawensis]|uniref:Iron-sulfur cluster repair di-iron protein n=1 Tax=Flammeovirga kamogawensis TaxID=373891 RepID=A0ABX8GYJ3_9BACT|nr:iron-sulfur cluster repair di-iron protein [Flammeovirga kamogawensis]MBB6459117.1 regulator of cell morphogenesis and NO signaling [Flammeovirga kamogawensis]QWG08686.1 iron-sulfur cluster repair di-iron protein [Flammeovirga kamogawensis]TRX66979.1 iron-sulfur cluster repair di-iron protein [Flammeovirga kamogawensis]